MTQIDPRIIQIREVLLQNVSEKYQALVETINKIGLHQEFKAEAIRQINSGFLWAKEGISILSVTFEEPIKDSAEKENSNVQNDVGTEL